MARLVWRILTRLIVLWYLGVACGDGARSGPREGHGGGRAGAILRLRFVFRHAPQGD